jgi:hypothetical protein
LILRRDAEGNVMTGGSDLDRPAVVPHG